MLSLSWSVYVFMCVVVEVRSQNAEPIVKITDGEVRGKYEVGNTGRQVSAFRGIPYAKPPIGSLRLQKPEKPESWTSTLDATKFGPRCPQLDLNGNVIGEENCLYINVYTPFIPGNGLPSSTYPVMVFIHGDNFQRGSADVYGPERFSNIVLVTFNYRIGILGFLSTGDDTCPGNLGLKDQLLALQWVRDNIQTFGGDSNLITLFGQGAGAASALLHILSPLSKGLFHRAITQSGSPLCDWALEENPYSHAETVAQKLRCSTKTKKALVDCIRSKPFREVVEAQRGNGTFGNYPLRTTPVVEKDGFLPNTPEKLLNAADFKPVPLFSGINKDDGALFYPMIISQQDNLKKDKDFLLKELIPKFLLAATDIRENIESVSQALYFHYFNRIDATNLTQVLQPFINMTTDAMFVSCNFKTLETYSAKGGIAYMYTFGYKGVSSMLEVETGRKLDYNGVSHGDELLYLFDISSSPLPSSLDSQIQSQLPFMWTNFARTGQSPLATQTLEPYTDQLKYYVQIESAQSVQTSYRQKEVDLWLDHLPKLSQIKRDNEVRTGGFGWAMLAIAIILMIVAVVLGVLLYRKSKTRYFGTSTEEK